MKAVGGTAPSPSRLLAKSIRLGREEVTLERHLADTDRAAELLFGPRSRWSAEYLRFFRIAAAERERFLLNLRVAALFHDIGKANADFYGAVTRAGSRQSVRHEHFSALFLHHPSVAAWLQQASGIDHDAVSAAVLSHHLKAARDGDFQWGQPRHAKQVRLWFEHPEVRLTLDRVAELLLLPKFAGEPPTGIYPTGAWADVLRSAHRAADRFALERAPAKLSFTTGLKAALIAADSVSSALVREGHDIHEWIEDVVYREPIDGDAIRRDIIDPRTRAISKRGAFIVHPFQQTAATLGPRALLLAACGAGKTLAAWMWAASIADARPVGRVIFLYPTRGTATEGFRDYVGWAPEGDAALVHGTARYELEGMAANPPESLRDKELVDETESRLFALGLWSKRYFSATVDQFLSFLEHRYESLCLLPALADSAIVLDEVHSYDRSMFRNLMAFLERFDVPTLCMTATVQPDRRRQLEGSGLRVFPSEAERTDLADLVAKEEHPRYRLEPIAGDEAALARVKAGFLSGRRVLWVVNVVKRCQALAKRLADELGVDVIAYHSRFRLCDRRRAHERTIEAFQAHDGPAIAVTTQVCEMSLDLDADVLVTEHAPVPSLVQRFGRANRHLRHGLGFRAELVTYPPPKDAPYERVEIEAGRAFLASLPEEASQRDLATALEAHAPRERDVDPLCRFLESGYYAVPDSFRDIDGFGVPAVLDRDVDEVVAALRRREAIDGFLLSVPRKHAMPGSSGLPLWVRIAPAAQYDPRLGFLEEVP